MNRSLKLTANTPRVKSAQLRTSSSVQFEPSCTGGLTFAIYSPTLTIVGDEKSNNALLIAASFIAAVRLAREEIKQTPKVMATISDSIRLAEMIQKQIEQRTLNSYS